LVFPGLPCDESGYIQDVVQLWNIKSNAVRPDIEEASFYVEEVVRYQDFPDYPNGVMMYPLMSLAREKGFRVLLTGSGGDNWLTGSFHHYADFLRRLKILSLIRQVGCDRQFKWDSAVPAIVFPTSPIFRCGLLPLVPPTVRRSIKRVLRRNGVPSWVDAQFARRIGLDERLHRQHTKLRFSSFAQKDIYCSELNSAFLSQGNELGSRSESWFSLEKRHPFLDRRVVEFALALPEEQRWQRNQPKFVLHRATEGFLPEPIRRRVSKADFSHVFAETLEAAGGEGLFNSITIESMRWVDGTVIREMHRRMVQDYRSANNAYISYIWKLWMVFGIELWFNGVFGRKQKVNWPNAA